MLVLGGATAAAAQTYHSGQNLQPVFEGWEQNADGSFNMVFGYLNRNYEEHLNIPIGSDNYFQPGDADRGQPAFFYPRRQRFTFRVRVPADWGDKELVWTVTAHGRTDRAVGWLVPEQIIDEQVVAMNRSGGGAPDIVNAAPSIVLVEGAERAVQVDEPLALTAIIRDDGIPEMRPAGQSRPPGRRNALGLRVAWIQYRGPGSVTFDPWSAPMEDHTPGWTPPPLPDDGRTVTTARFSEPGTYIIRGMADDGYLYSAADVTVTVTAPPQGARVTVWDGIYTAEQAARGRAVYDSRCASCHGADLSGSSEARPLAGERFMQDWSEDHLGNLFTRIQRLMPYDDPGALGDGAYLDSLAYILESNGFPSGDTALNTAGVDEIRIEGEDGPGLVPSFALVQVIGCLTPGPDGDWTLTRSTRAARTRDPAASSPDRLGSYADQPLGDRTFGLMSAYPDPAPHAGHKMEAKGFLIRDPAGDRINLSSLEMVAERCEP